MAVIAGRHIQSRPNQAPGNGGYAEQLANGLGWFSIGLGVVEVLAPRKIAQLIGVSDQADRRTLVRFYGVREIAAGVGILSRQSPVGGMWGRVAGDLVDLATLGAIMGSKNANRTRTGVAAAAVLGVAALDLYCSQKLTQAQLGDGRIRMTKSIIVDRSPEEVYAFWKKIETFPRFVDHLESVHRIGEKDSHWKVAAPGGMRVEWDAEVKMDDPNALIAWESKPGADIGNAGTVRFERATGGRGTVIKVDFEYTAPAGKTGAGFAKLFGMEPGQMVETALRRMKQILETGDIVRSEASIHRGLHPAVPPAGRRSISLASVSANAAALPQPKPTTMEEKNI